MGQRVELNARQIREFEILKRMLEEEPSKPKIMGRCKGCNKPIPYGYVPTVTRWKSKELGKDYRVAEADEMYCKQCVSLVEVPKRHYRHRIVEEEPVTLSPKEVAIALLKVMSYKHPHGSRKLAKLAALEYSDVILVILRKLKDAGKIALEDGRWKRV